MRERYTDNKTYNKIELLSSGGEVDDRVLEERGWANDPYGRNLDFVVTFVVGTRCVHVHCTRWGMTRAHAIRLSHYIRAPSRQPTDHIRPAM